MYIDKLNFVHYNNIVSALPFRLKNNHRVTQKVKLCKTADPSKCAYRERHAAAKQLQSSLTCRDVVKKKCGNSNCQSDTFIKPSSKMADHGGVGGRDSLE